ncbi:hypothetical protein GLYMA_19G121650v4 [Glycine max]|nr:hypothetical protein GLYMA_19G121650v4 [Glycine max]KAH1077472.1 hypothetical protein GYH30_052824 [Glycine max]
MNICHMSVISVLLSDAGVCWTPGHDKGLSLSGLVVDLGSLKSLSGNVSYLQKFEGLEILLQRKSGKFF